MWDERTGGGPRALPALALLVLTLGLLPPESLLRARAQPGLIHLPAGEFEHLTQASTGQTTGIWLVVFMPSRRNCDECSGLANSHLEVLAENLAGATLVATVDVSLEGKEVAEQAAAKDLTKRFALANDPPRPDVILFRDRKMFRYEGNLAVEDLQRFALTEFAVLDGQDVPKPRTFFDKFIATFKSYFVEQGRNVEL